MFVSYVSVNIANFIVGCLEMENNLNTSTKLNLVFACGGKKMNWNYTQTRLELQVEVVKKKEEEER